MSWSYPQALQYLYGLQRHGIKPGLGTISALLARLHDPHQRYRILHIGGTNGKGSVAAMTATILQAANMRVGLYTSPHLNDFRERIRVKQNPIPPERVATLAEQIRMVLSPSLSPTFFEFTTAMAFQHFAEETVDVAVVEVGMGGRFDATNVCNPVGAAITNVALDHEAYLGTTLTAIAREKAGIIKRQVPVVIGPMPHEARRVIEDYATAQRAPLYRYGREFHVSLSPENGLDTFDYQGIRDIYPHLTCALAGRHQLLNAGCAIALLEVSGLLDQGSREAAVRTGLATVKWEGRLETVEVAPRLLLDGAHNPAAAAELAPYLQQLQTRARGGKTLVLVGMMRDKDIQGFLSHLLSVGDVFIFTQINHPRAASVQELHARLCDETKPAYLCPAPGDALSLARRLAAPQDVICVTGSLFLVGYVKRLLCGQEHLFPQ
ncbi:MAG: bifunctional folylpolyglutamate synthase/dihydrofolate synthase [Nitrospirae bacterium]|nr:MAG: bifunctional folylpolyglutamate synthase/dihydrofolate synthase [Nitrospirota bacterium]